MLDTIGSAMSEAQMMTEILAIIGGARRESTPLQLVHHIEQGLPVASLENVSRSIAPTDTNFKYRFVSKPTLTRRMRAAMPRLTPEESNHVARIAKLWTRARDVWQSDEAARAFLTRSHPLLEGRSPIDIAMGSELGADLADQILGRLQYGSAA